MDVRLDLTDNDFTHRNIVVGADVFEQTLEVWWDAELSCWGHRHTFFVVGISIYKFEDLQVYHRLGDDASIALRHQLGAVTEIVVSGQLLKELTNT